MLNITNLFDAIILLRFLKKYSNTLLNHKPAEQATELLSPWSVCAIENFVINLIFHTFWFYTLRGS